MENNDRRMMNGQDVRDAMRETTIRGAIIGGICLAGAYIFGQALASKLEKRSDKAFNRLWNSQSTESDD